MKIAVASGKGGTGKTTVAVSLALSVEHVQYLDCDVEEPNAAIFLKPAIKATTKVQIPVPEIDTEKCNYCKKCVDMCAFHALAVVGRKALVFPEMCHGCGGCAYICPQKAITEKNRTIGVIEHGWAGNIDFIQGRINVGEPMTPAVIKKQRSFIDTGKTVILDAPPGTSCPVIETIRGMDFCLLVTEPTPFGFNDLKLAIEMVRDIKVPFGVVINQQGIGDDDVSTYCTREKIPVLMRIAWDRRIAEGYSRGVPLVTVLPEQIKGFRGVMSNIHNRLHLLSD